MFSGYAENVYQPTDNVIMAHCAEHGVNLPRKCISYKQSYVNKFFLDSMQDYIM